MVGDADAVAWCIGIGMDVEAASGGGSRHFPWIFYLGINYKFPPFMQGAPFIFGGKKSAIEIIDSSI